MKPKLLITGASGFLGFHLIEAALAEGLEVHAGVRKSSDVSHLQHLDITFVDVDMRSVPALTALMQEQQYSYVIHAAGATRAKDAAAFNEINAAYTKHLLDAIVQSGVPLQRFVFVSSLAAVGPKAYSGIWPEQEELDPAPVTLYGKSKLLAEQYLKEYSNIPWIVLRPTAIYGPRDKDLFVLFKTYGWRIEPYMGRKPQHLSFVYVKDVAQAAIRALKSEQVNASYDVSDGHSYDKYALANVTKKLLGVRTLRIHVPLTIIRWIASISEAVSSGAPLLNRDRLNELTAENWNCSIIRLKKDLGYQPEFTLEEGMRETLDWYTGNKWL